MNLTAIPQAFPTVSGANAQTGGAQTDAGKSTGPSFIEILGGATDQAKPKNARAQTEDGVSGGQNGEKQAQESQADAEAISVLGSMLVCLSMPAQTPEPAAQSGLQTVQADEQAPAAETQAVSGAHSQSHTETFALTQTAQSAAYTQQKPEAQTPQAVQTPETMAVPDAQSQEAPRVAQVPQPEAAFSVPADAPSAQTAYISGELSAAETEFVAAGSLGTPQGAYTPPELQNMRTQSDRENRISGKEQAADGIQAAADASGQMQPVLAKTMAENGRSQADVSQENSQAGGAADASTEKAGAVKETEKPFVLQEDAAKASGQGVQTALSAITGASDTQAANKAESAVLHSQTAVEQVTEKISQAIGEGSASFKMKLHPEGLGQVDVTLTCEKGKVSLEILASVYSTKQLLEGQAGELKAALGAKNFDLTHMDVQAQTNTGFSLNSFSGQTSGGNSAWQPAQRTPPVYAGAQHTQESAAQAYGRPEYTGRLNYTA